MLSKMRMNRNKQGFTLIELMIVVAIIGILAAIAIPQFARMRQKGQDAAATSALGNLKTAQEAYYLENDTYATDTNNLISWYSPEEHVTVIILAGADGDSWSATAQHDGSTNVFTYSSSDGGLQ